MKWQLIFCSRIRRAEGNFRPPGFTRKTGCAPCTASACGPGSSERISSLSQKLSTMYSRTMQRKLRQGGFRWMWKSTTFHVGRHLGAVGQPRTAPRVAASGAFWMSVPPLLFHSSHLGAKRFPVAFRYRRFLHFLDDFGEVLQAGNRRSDPGVDHCNILAGASEQDCAPYLLQRSSSPMQANRNHFVGSREAGLNAGRGQEQAAYLSDELCFRLRWETR